MKVKIYLKNKTVVDIERLTSVTVCAEKTVEYAPEKISRLPLKNELSYVFVGNKTVAISGAEILFVEFD